MGSNNDSRLLGAHLTGELGEVVPDLGLLGIWIGTGFAN